VGFRWACQQKARELNISGWVRNEPDGSVSISAEGMEKPLAEFISWCRIGPVGAEIKSVIIKEDQFADFSGFRIF
jgi:acylphosphatase